VFFLTTACASSLKLTQWRETVGPVLAIAPPAVSTSNDPDGRLIVVNWNMHVGNGNIEALVDDLSKREASGGQGKPEFVFLLQETFRRGSEIPDPGRSSVPGRIAPPNSAMDIQGVARRLGWWMYYAPSMRNGKLVGEDAEDRGNAILSSLPLDAVEAIELPFVVQRRVALIATVTDAQKKPRLRVAVAHLDTRAPVAQGWILGGPVIRKRQAEGFVAALRKFDDDLPLVVGGDLNTLLGSGEGAVDTVSRLASRAECGGKATHNSGFVLDHMFTRIPHGWKSAGCSRMDDTFGSDHFPLVLPLALSW
jgi:endonuclease/exonuclease/phosphatase family metal-dependent hydrolase